MKVVIDCNVVVSAARAGGTCGKVIAEAERHHKIILSQPILGEYLEISRRPKHAHYRNRRRRWRRFGYGKYEGFHRTKIRAGRGSFPARFSGPGKIAASPGV